MLRLHVVPAHGEPFEVPLEGDSIVVGRSSDCDLVIADRFLSRHHARLARRGPDWLVEDMGSRNGTLLNGARIDKPSPLKAGDDIQLSGSVVSVRRADAAATAAGTDFSSTGDSSQHTIFRRASELIDSSPSAPETESPQVLRGYADRLRMLNEVHRALAGTIELDELLELILKRAFELLEPEEGVVFLRRADGSYDCAARRTAHEGASDYLYSETLVREVAEKGLAALVLDAETDERFAAAESILSSGVRSLVAAPLLDADGSLGMIALNSRIHRRQFSEPDMELLVSLASVAALRIRNVALAVEAAERRRLEEELKLARQIQVALLPERLPEVAGFELFGRNLPSRGVSGDLYEAVERPQQDDCVVWLADVSGKGIAASLLTASVEALAAGPIEVGCPPDEICGRVNRRLHRRTPASKYATAFVAVLRPQADEIAYCNAGQNPPLVVRADGDIEQLGPTGPPVGLLSDATYSCGRVLLAPGDLMVLYTDGITEATNGEEEEYGPHRLEAACRAHRRHPLAELARALEGDLESFAEGTPFADDRTVLLLRRL